MTAADHEKRVWLAQCLCPERHCILAAADLADSAAEAQAIVASLEQAVAEVLAKGLIDPWCGLCRAPAESWRVEVGRTAWRDLADARPVLEQVEREQRATAAAWRSNNP